jgi:hypothetical protein
MEDSRGYAGQQDRSTAISICGAVAGALIFGVVLIGIVVEASQLWRHGVAIFLSDAGMRLFVGACLGLLSAAPYMLLARASRKTGPPMLFLMAAIAMLAIQLWVMAYILFIARSSTAPIALMFMPLYLGVAAIAVWVAAVLIRVVRRHR